MATKALLAVQRASPSCTCHRRISAPAKPLQNSHFTPPDSGHLAVPTYTHGWAVVSEERTRRWWFETASDSDWSMIRLWAYLHQTLFQIIGVAYALLIHSLLKTDPNFVSQLRLGRNACLLLAYRQFEIQFCCVLAGADIRRWHVHDRPAHSNAGSALIVMATAAAGTPLY